MGQVNIDKYIISAAEIMNTPRRVTGQLSELMRCGVLIQRPSQLFLSKHSHPPAHHHAST